MAMTKTTPALDEPPVPVSFCDKCGAILLNDERIIDGCSSPCPWRRRRIGTGHPPFLSISEASTLISLILARVSK